MSDPFLALRAAAAPTRPDPAFAARLRARLEAALTRSEEVPRMTLTPYLAVADARRAIDWYADAFGAHLRGDPVVMPDGRVGHAELDLGGALLMLADEHPALGHAAPRPGAGVPVTLHLETADLDALVYRAAAAGAVLARPPADNPYGRNAVVVDPFGHRWLVSGQPAAAAPPPTTDAAYLSFAVPDLDRATAFYGAVLGWAFDEGRVVGATPPMTFHGGSPRGDLAVCWHVADVAAAADRVRRLGGTATDPGRRPYGTTSDCTDDQGMVFYLWEPPAGSAPGPSDGRIAYLTVNVVDSARFRAFFGGLFGWTFSPGRVADGWEVEGPRPMTGVAGGAARASTVPMYRVPDVEAAVGRVRAAGGTATDVVAMPYGLTSDCTDDQGSPFYLGQL